MERKKIVDELIYLLEHGNAHVPFEKAVDKLPQELRTRIPHNLPYSIWQLVEHMRIAQWDIVEFSLSAKHESPEWPEGYWVDPVDEVDDMTWKASLNQISEDRQRFIDALKDEDNDLSKPFPHGTGQTLLREALLIADHNAYHTGEILVVRRLLNDWK